MPDFSNGLGGDSNSGPFWPPGVYSSPTRIMAQHKLARKRTLAANRSLLTDFAKATLSHH